MGNEFVQLRRGSDWGTEYLSYDPLDSSNRASASRGIVTREGQEVEVSWPDQSITVEKLTHRSFRAQVGDMGHTYSVSFDLPGVVLSTRGISTWTPLDTLDLKVRANAFTSKDKM